MRFCQIRRKNDEVILIRDYYAKDIAIIFSGRCKLVVITCEWLGDESAHQNTSA